MKRQAANWQKVVATDPGLELPQINKNHTSNPGKHGWGDKGNSQDRNPNHQSNDENVSAPLIRDTQIKHTKERPLAPPPEWHKFQSLTIGNMSLDVEEQKLAASPSDAGR